MFLRNGSVYNGAPLPSIGSARVAFPDVNSTIRALRLPASTTGRLFIRFPLQHLFPKVRSCVVGISAQARSRSSHGTIDYLKSVKTGSPRFLENPSHTSATLSDPGRSELVSP